MEMLNEYQHLILAYSCYLSAYGVPIFLSLLVYVFTVLIFKSWVIERQVCRPVGTGNMNQKIRPTLKNTKKRTSFSPPSKKSLILSTSTFNLRSGKRMKKKSKCKERLRQDSKTCEIDFEAELQKSYCQAARLMYTDITEEQIRRALTYMKINGKFSQGKTSHLLIKTIMHIQNLEEWMDNLNGERDLVTGFPVELSKDEIEDRLLKIDMWERGEIRYILKHTFSEYGFYPIPTEFCEIYENKKDQLAKTSKRLKKKNSSLRKEVIMYKQRCINHAEIKRAKEELVNELKELQKSEQRHMCKICASNELSIMVLPCRHVYSCSDCFKEQCAKCLICQLEVFSHEFFYLS